MSTGQNGLAAVRTVVACGIAVALLSSRVGVAAEPPVRVAATDLKKLSVEELLDVEVSSVSRRPERLLDTPAAVEVITAEDLRRSGATRIPDALRIASHLEVAQIGASNWAISSRGFNTGLGNKLLVMVDGRTVYTPLFAGVFWDVQDAIVEDLERIEVVSGPGGTVWGANAVNGVISVTSKRAADTQGLLVQAGGGDELESYAGARFGGSFGESVQYRVYGKYTDLDHSVLPTGVAWTDGAHLGQGGFRADLSPGERDALTVQGDLYDGASGQLSTANRAEYDGGNLLGRWERTLGPEADLKLQVYFDRARRLISAQFIDDLHTWDLDLQHRFAVGARHDVVWGLGIRQVDNTFVSTPLLAFLPPTLNHTLYSAFAQDEIALADDRIRVTVGSKLEHNEYTGLEVQPNLRLAVRAADNQAVWAAISRAIRAPARIDRDLFIPNQPPFLIAGGPDFESEVLLAHELGYRAQVAERLSFDLAAFYNDYDRLRSVESANPPDVFPFVVRNGLKGVAHGAELTVDYRPIEGWRLVASYDWLKLKLRVAPGHLDTTSVLSEARDPRQRFALRSMLDLTASLRLDAAYRSVSRIVNDAVPGYDELDVQLAWRPMEQIEVAVLGRNLLHDRHAEFNPLASRREIERSLFGMVTWRY
jgi:iron complex outermembrane recepter protein